MFVIANAKTRISQIGSSLSCCLLLAAAMSMTFGLSLPAKAQESTPTATVQSVVNAILAILRSGDFNLDRDRPAIRIEIQNAFDDVAMAQSVLSTNWRGASAEEQNEFKTLLMQTIESTYIGCIRAYTNESVVFRDEQIDNNRASVDTAVLAASGEIPLVYKLRKRSDGWFVYDVEIENVSMVSTYRETYRSVVKRSGMSGLLEQMREKIIELEGRETP